MDLRSGGGPVSATNVFKTRSREETIALGRQIAPLIMPCTGQSIMLILRGDLGAGKTTLVKGIAAALGVAEPDDVTSPTFTLIHEYEGPETEDGSNIRLFHLDLYRLETERELLALGLEELQSAGALVLVEWGEKFPSLLAHADGEIVISIDRDDARTVVLELTPSPDGKVERV